MKAFYAILFLFILLLAAINANYFYVSKLSQELIEELEQLPPPDGTQEMILKAEQIRQKWQNQKRFVQITVNHTEIELISNTATELCVFAQHQNEAEFEKARHILISALEELKSSEKLSPINIL